MRAFHSLLVVLMLNAPLAIAEDDAPRPGDLNPADVVVQLPSMPSRGTTMESVRSRLGDPGREVAAVGEPPISRWVYPEFTVYFEHNRVLHSVKNRTR